VTGGQKCLSELINSLKGVSSRCLKGEFPAIPTFWSARKSDGSAESPNYFVGSVGGAPIEILRQYIENQGRSEPPRERPRCAIRWIFDCATPGNLESARRMIARSASDCWRRYRDFARRFRGRSGTATIGRAIRARRLGRLPGRETGSRILVDTFADSAARFCSRTVSTAAKPLACHAGGRGFEPVALVRKSAHEIKWLDF
jgi:Transposase IS200 like